MIQEQIDLVYSKKYMYLVQNLIEKLLRNPVENGQPMGSFGLYLRGGNYEKKIVVILDGYPFQFRSS